MPGAKLVFVLDREGVRQVLHSPEVRELVDEAAEQIAERVRAQVPAGTVVEVRQYSTDREAASVSVKDVRGMIWQARDGLLTRAAVGIGAEVKERGR